MGEIANEIRWEQVGVAVVAILLFLKGALDAYVARVARKSGTAERPLCNCQWTRKNQEMLEELWRDHCGPGARDPFTGIPRWWYAPPGNRKDED